MPCFLCTEIARKVLLEYLTWMYDFKKDDVFRGIMDRNILLTLMVSTGKRLWNYDDYDAVLCNAVSGMLLLWFVSQGAIFPCLLFALLYIIFNPRKTNLHRCSCLRLLSSPRASAAGARVLRTTARPRASAPHMPCGYWICQSQVPELLEKQNLEGSSALL